MGSRRRGLRSRPPAAGRHPRPRSGLCAGRSGQPARAHRRPARSASIGSRRRCPARAWQKHSAGAGSHGHRYYSWAWITLLAEDDTDTGCHHLLIRRNDATGEHAYLRCYSRGRYPAHPGGRGRTTLAHRGILPSRQRASPGWTSTKSGAGPPGTAGPPWPCSPMPSWPWPPPPNVTPNPPPTGLITLTVNEFRRLFDALLLAARHTITTLLRLVTLASTTPTPSPPKPLQTTRTPMITNYGCSTTTPKSSSESRLRPVA